MKDAGYGTSGATPYWNQASGYGATPQQFAEYFNGIDGALGQPNGGLSMDEWEAYLNNNGYDEDVDREIIKLLYNTRWRKPKYDGEKYEPLAEEFDLSVVQTKRIVYKQGDKVLRRIRGAV